MVLNTRLLGAILLAIVIAAAMVARIPVTTMQQTAKAYKYCSRTFLTQDGLYPFQGVSDPIHCSIQGWPSCYSVGYSAGWYHAQGDWNTLQYGLYSYGNSACPRGHSVYIVTDIMQDT